MSELGGTADAGGEESSEPSAAERSAAGSPYAEYAATLDAMFDPVHVITPDLRIVLMNAAFKRWMERLGLAPDVIGRPLFEVFPFLPRTVHDEYRTVLERGEAVVSRDTTPIGDRLYHTETRKLPIVRQGRVVRVVTVVHDITELMEAAEQRRKLDSQLQQTQKLESLGVLAGGIAHDFNNLLTALMGRLSLAARAVDDPTLQRDLAEASRAGEQAVALTKQLLTFARGGVPVRELARLGPLARETTEFCLRGSQVRAEFSLEDHELVAIDVGQMRQVVQNLVMNAEDSMPAGGTLRVQTRDQARDGLPWVELEVADSGTGIPAESLARIFDPYFTTKATGSGLGLAVAHSVVRKHEGSIAVRSQVGAGTTFSVLLPAAPGTAPPSEPEPPSRPGRRLHVLVMDDEPDVRSVLEDMLKRAGHRVVGVREGAEAVARYRRALVAGERFDAVLLDLTVPGGMPGLEAARALLQADPTARLIVSSGYSENAVMARFADHGFAAALAKPYGFAQLLGALARATEPRR
jgi:PAS domain S-box-containing protein